MDLSLTEWITRLLVSTFLLIGLLTAFSHGRRLLRERESRARRVVCRLCLHAFEDAGLSAIVKCPVCGADNLRGRRNGVI